MRKSLVFLKNRYDYSLDYILKSLRGDRVGIMPDTLIKEYNKLENTAILYGDVVATTLTSNGTTIYYNEKRNLNDIEYKLMSTFPVDYDF